MTKNFRANLNEKGSKVLSLSCSTTNNFQELPVSAYESIRIADAEVEIISMYFTCILGKHSLSQAANWQVNMQYDHENQK